MTTTVIVKAHCATDKEVKVMVTSPDMVQPEMTTIQDGEEYESVVYDDREISVKEVCK